MRHRMGDRNELDVERTDLKTITIVDRNQVGLAEQSGLFDSVTSKSDRERRAVDREAQLTQQVAERANVILVCVCRDTSDDAMPVLS